MGLAAGVNDVRRAMRRLRPRRAVGIVVGGSALVVSVVLSLVFSTGGPRSSSATVDRSVAGTRAPAFTLPGLSGGTVRSSQFGGQVTVINFWASWCVPCREEAPVLRTLARTWGPKGVQFLGVVENDAATAARRFRHHHRMTWPSAIDAGRAVADAFGVRGVPETYVIGADGMLAAKVLGRLHKGQLDAAIARASSAAKSRRQSGQ